MQGPGSPTKGSPIKSRVDISSPRKRVDDGEDDDEVGGGGGDKAKKNKKGLWNLFNAEYEI